MGIDYSCNLAVGFRVTQKMLKDCFGCHVPEQTKLEDRYDPKTGKKLAPVKIIVEEDHTALMWDGEDVDDDNQLIDFICDHVGASYWHDGSYMSDPDQMEFVIGPKFKTSPGPDHGDFDAGGGIKYPDLLILGPEISRIGHALLELGLDIDEKAEVTLVTLVS